MYYIAAHQTPYDYFIGLSDNVGSLSGSYTSVVIDFYYVLYENRIMKYCIYEKKPRYDRTVEIKDIEKVYVIDSKLMRKIIKDFFRLSSEE